MHINTQCLKITLLKLMTHTQNKFFYLELLPSPSSYCLLQESVESHSLQLFETPWTIPWNSPGQITGVDSCSSLQGIFPTQGSNPGLLHCRQILYHLSYQGSPFAIGQANT